MTLTLEVTWLLTPCSISCRRPAMLWKREASVSADDKAACREGIDDGLDAISCIPLKKPCKAGDMPEAGSPSMLSIRLIWVE